MNKEELLALCLRLGIVADATMSKPVLEGLLNTHNPVDANQHIATPVADATASLTKKQSTIKGFRYSPEFVNIVFVNGDSAILGLKDAETIRLAIEIKGQSVDYSLGKEETSKRGTKYHKVLIECIY